MWIENILYLVAFIISAGMSAIGILVSYQLYQLNKKDIFGTLLYYQIFLFSFLFYGVWGNLALRVLLSDMNLNEVLNAKLAFFVPIIGMPFMLVSWFMLLRFAFNINGYKFKKVFIYGYFPTFVVIVFTIGFLIHKGVLLIPDNANLFVIRILAGLNLLVHLFFVLPFFKPKKNAPLLIELGFNKQLALFFITVVFIYSAALSFINIFGFISICIAISLLFGAGIFVPVAIRLKTNSTECEKDFDFAAFCELFEISKREAEIVLEICSGKSNKAIADKLFITLQTVKDHNHRIFTKTGVRSRIQLTNLVREKTGQK